MLLVVPLVMNGCNSSFNTAQMANHLVKWWRTKFCSGYKSFNVDCNEGRASSDIEELLDRRNSDYHRTCTTPPLQTQSTRIPPSPSVKMSASQPNRQHLSLQGFSWDVSVEGVDKYNQDRQEFSFTLYDFDGYGKITKDDIAGLVTTIYEVLGKTVKVPHYGSKTIKVKLTVSPDQKKHVRATVIDRKDNKSEKTPINNVKTKKDLNTSNRHSVNDKKRICRHHRKKREEKKFCCETINEEYEIEPEDSENISDLSSSRVSPVIDTSEHEGEYRDDQVSKCNNKLHRKHYRKHSTSKFAILNKCNKELNTLNQQNCFLHTKRSKKSSSSLQKQELVEIIQSNMNKNNTCFQTMGKQNIDHASTKQLLHHPVRHRKHHYKSVRMPTTPLHSTSNAVDSTHFYVDLAKYESHDAHNGPFCYQSSEYPIINIEKPIKKSSQTMNEYESPTNGIRKFPHPVTGHTSSPHYLKHKTRQEDHARAMEQVVKWLEKEFSSDLNTNDTKEKNQSNCDINDEQKYSNKPNSPNSSIEHHEHHHVHEHVHHHYHHYEDSPIIV